MMRRDPYWPNARRELADFIDTAGEYRRRAASALPIMASYYIAQARLRLHCASIVREYLA